MSQNPTHPAFEYITLVQHKWGDGADHKKRDEAEAFIVGAVNHHAALVEALDSVLKNMPFSANWDSEGRNPNWLKDARDVLRPAQLPVK